MNKHFNWENASVLLAFKLVCLAFAWFMLYVRRTSSLAADAIPGSKPASSILPWPLLQILPWLLLGNSMSPGSVSQADQLLSKFLFKRSWYICHRYQKQMETSLINEASSLRKLGPWQKKKSGQNAENNWHWDAKAQLTQFQHTLHLRSRKIEECGTER